MFLYIYFLILSSSNRCDYEMQNTFPIQNKEKKNRKTKIILRKAIEVIGYDLQFDNQNEIYKKLSNDTEINKDWINNELNLIEEVISSCDSQDNQIDIQNDEELTKIINYLQSDKIDSYCVFDVTNNADNNIENLNILDRESNKIRNLDNMQKELESINTTFKQNNNNSKRYVCGFDNCDKSYLQKKNLYRHMKNDHDLKDELDYSYVCEVEGCEGIFQTQRALNIHMTKIHGK